MLNKTYESQLATVTFMISNKTENQKMCIIPSVWIFRESIHEYYIFEWLKKGGCTHDSLLYLILQLKIIAAEKVQYFVWTVQVM